MSCIVTEKIVLSPVVNVKKVDTCAVDYSQFQSIQLQVNGVNDGLANFSPFNICVFNSLGNQVGVIDNPFEGESTLQGALQGALG